MKNLAILRKWELIFVTSSVYWLETPARPYWELAVQHLLVCVPVVTAVALPILPGD